MHICTLQEPGSTLKLEAPWITLINATTFMCTCKLEGSMNFMLDLALLEISSHATSVPEPYDLVDLLGIPKDYHDFTDVFSKAKANRPAPHEPYDLKITLEDGKEPPQPPIYPLSTSKLKTLREFLDEHLNIGFIRPSRSSHRAPILFINKKDGSLWLCVDFHALNKVTKRGHYLLPLISDLLDVPQKARIYSKINLRHTYHLV